MCRCCKRLMLDLPSLVGMMMLMLMTMMLRMMMLMLMMMLVILMRTMKLMITRFWFTGLEGTAAAQASDFAFTKFHFLRRALLVHGHWSASLLLFMIISCISYVH